jgi:hypothetical protein
MSSSPSPTTRLVPVVKTRAGVDAIPWLPAISIANGSQRDGSARQARKAS